LDVGLAGIGGLGIVLLAIMLDRITQVLGQANPVPWQKRGPIGLAWGLLSPQKAPSS
jgi:hypothetical protein